MRPSNTTQAPHALFAPWSSPSPPARLPARQALCGSTIGSVAREERGALKKCDRCMELRVRDRVIPVCVEHLSQPAFTPPSPCPGHSWPGAATDVCKPGDITSRSVVGVSRCRGEIGLARTRQTVLQQHVTLADEVGARRHASVRLEAADEMRLIGVAGLMGERSPGHALARV